MLDDEADRLITALDISVFQIASATTPGDKRSMLMMANFARNFFGRYTFLEIGSYLGGGLLPHLVNPYCSKVISIDKRPDFQDDERATRFSYQGITTEAMVERLRQHAPAEAMKKLQTFDVDAVDLSKQKMEIKIDCAFIDGEHTNVATFSDFLSVYPALSRDAIIGFHDANLVSDAIANACRFLVFIEAPHKLFFVPDVVAIIALGSSQATADQVFGPIAAPHDQFIRDAKRNLRQEIAASVQRRDHIS
jgi:hypothetical protein